MTTTPNELRAAAERIRETAEFISDSSWQDGDGKWHGDHHPIRSIEREKELADAYLSTHPPDADEPISEEWLLSSGWEWDIVRRAYVVRATDSDGDRHFIRFFIEDAMFLLGTFSITVKTRQQLRDLLAALGVVANKNVGV